MKRLLTILLLPLLFQVISCKKYLDKKTDNTLTTIDRLEDLQALLDSYYINPDRVPIYGDASSDDYFLTDQNYFSNGASDLGEACYKWELFNYTYDNGNDWAKAYVPVNIADICLEEIKRFPRSSTNTVQWNNIKGSALFIRAFYFLNLSWIYGKAYDSITSSTDLGIALQLSTDIHTPTIRASVADCYEQIISDTKAAIIYLPDIGLHPLRPSKAAACALLARAYLSMRLYDSAFKYADQCLQIRQELINFNGDADIINPIQGTNPPFRQYNKETIFYADMIDGSPYYLINSGNIDTSLYASYADDDLRKTAFFRPDVNGYQKFKGNYTQGYPFFGGITTAEIFLTRAECFARKGMITEAMADLNALLIKRWKNTVTYPVITATDVTDALNKILAERRKELIFRGLRWPDIKRLNKEGANILLKRVVVGQPYELLPNSDKYALPLPQEIIDLTGVPQNPGWQ